MTRDTITTLTDPHGFSPDPLTDLLRSGAQRLIEQAVEAELTVLLEAYGSDKTGDGRARLVRHGHLPEREVMTGIGAVPVKVPRVRDRGDTAEKVRFTSTILPPYLRKAKSIEELLPWLYLKGISTGDFHEALAALLGPNAAGLSSTTISRLKSDWWDEYDRWQHRDLSTRRFVYIWADGVYFRPRMAEEKQCVLVLIGADEWGRKEIIGLADGYREREADANMVKDAIIAAEADGTLTLTDATGAVGGDENEALRLLEADGMTINTAGVVISKATGLQDEGYEMTFYDNYVRVDVALDGEYSITDGGGSSPVLNQFKGSIMVSMPRRDSAGNEYMQIRIREKDLEGAAWKFGSDLETKLGLTGTHELVIPIYTDVVDESAQEGVTWRSTVAAQGKVSADLPAAGNAFLGLLGQAADLGTANMDFDWDQLTSGTSSGRTYALEMGGGAGYSTTYDLEGFGDDWWKPLVYEGVGAVAGVGVAILGAGLAEVFTDGAATEFIAVLSQICCAFEVQYSVDRVIQRAQQTA